MFNLQALLALRERGHETRVVRCVPWTPPFKTRWQRYRTVPTRYDVDGVPVRTLRGLMGPSNWGIGTLGAQLRARLQAEIDDFAPDVVHAHGLLPSGAVALATSLPIVVTGHGSETYALPWQRESLTRLARTVLVRSAAVAAVSEFVASHLRRLGARAVQIVPNGADDQLFIPRDRAQACRDLGLDPDRRYVLFVGHLLPDKGVLELVEALRALKPLGIGALFAGTGVLAASLAQSLAEAGVDATFLGPLPHERLAVAYAACTVFTLPSYREGLPTVICEAMNAARAVVATRVGGIPEIVRDGVTGRLVDPKDAAALAAALRDVIENSDVREQMEHAALADARDRLTWSANAAAYERIYASVIERVPAPIRREDSLVVP